MINVIYVGFKSMIPIEIISAVYLCPTCKPWPYVMTSVFLICIPRQILNKQGSWTNYTHVSDEDIEKLRAKVRKEKQFNRQVELNAKLKKAIEELKNL